MDERRFYMQDNTILSILAQRLRGKVNNLLLVYGLMIVGTTLLFLLVLGLCIAAVWGMLASGVIYGRLIVFMIGAVIAAGICLNMILGPLFQIFKPEKNDSIEIKREDYPELFALIDEVVDKVDCLHPKHVYLSNDCNAYVNYHSLLGYLSHGPQNLTIGIPLLYALNKTEFKSVLCHEFGHFTQKSTVINYVANLSEYICGVIAQLQESIEKTDDDSIAANASGFANIVTKIMLKQYHKVAPLNGELSRAQEYDADRFSYEIVGTEGSISALCKIDAISNRWDQNYLRWLWMMIKQKRCPADVKGLFDKFFAGLDAVEDKPLKPEFHYKPVLGEYDSRMSSLEDTDTHPTTAQRFNAIASYPFIETLWDDESAFDYFPEEVVNERFQSVVITLKSRMYPETTQFLTRDIRDEELLVSLEGRTSIIFNYFYADSVFCEVGLGEEYTNPKQIAFPFTRENATILRQYMAAKQDLITLEGIVEENNQQRRYKYNGKEYTGTNVPIEEHRAYYKPLYEEAKQIALQCNLWILEHSQNDVQSHDCLPVLLSVKHVDLSLRSGIDNMQSVIHIWKAVIKSTKATEFVNSMEKWFREIVSDYFIKDGQGKSRFDQMCTILGVKEEYISSAEAFMAKEKRDTIEEFCNVYNTVGTVFADYFNYIWGLVRLQIIQPEFTSSAAPSVGRR